MSRVRRWSVLVLLVVVLAGCGSVPKHWARDGSGESDFRRDSYACSRDSEVQYGGSGLVLLILMIGAERDSKRIYKECMEARGWRATE